MGLHDHVNTEQMLRKSLSSYFSNMNSDSCWTDYCKRCVDVCVFVWVWWGHCTGACQRLNKHLQQKIFVSACEFDLACCQSSSFCLLFLLWRQLEMKEREVKVYQRNVLESFSVGGKEKRRGRWSQKNRGNRVEKRERWAWKKLTMFKDGEVNREAQKKRWKSKRGKRGGAGTKNKVWVDGSRDEVRWGSP